MVPGSLECETTSERKAKSGRVGKRGFVNGRKGRVEPDTPDWRTSFSSGSGEVFTVAGMGVIA
jgi:hypothetical protein